MRLFVEIMYWIEVCTFRFILIAYWLCWSCSVVIRTIHLVVSILCNDNLYLHLASASIRIMQYQISLCIITTLYSLQNILFCKIHYLLLTRIIFFLLFLLYVSYSNQVYQKEYWIKVCCNDWETRGILCDYSFLQLSLVMWTWENRFLKDLSWYFFP